MAQRGTRLKDITEQVDESMGRRHTGLVAIQQTGKGPQFSPVPHEKDIGRRPSRAFGKLELDRIIPDPEQPRREFDANEIKRLAASLQQVGQLQPIRVRWSELHWKWVIIAGERRYRAALAAKWPTIDCYFEESELDESTTLEQQLIENLQREDLKPLEEARAYAGLMALNDWNGKQLAESLNVTTSRVSRALALLDLPDDVQTRVQSGDLSRTSAYELTKLDNVAVQRQLAQQASEGAVTQRDIAGAAQRKRGKRTQRAAGVNLTFVAENGIRVQVHSAHKQNYHEVLEALQQATEEVQLRIDNRVDLR